jgi:L-lactate dehydrogenase complex protein LldG
VAAGEETAREAMLAALRRAAPAPVPLPELAGLGVQFADPAAQFAEVLATVGGTCLRVPDLAAARWALAERPIYTGAVKMISLVDGLGRTDVDLSAISDPRDLEGLDLAILPGELAVAENGAVWLDSAALPHRALFVITQHLVLVTDARNVVNDMHEAYAGLAHRPPAHGVFISGPSKTADIEQALVIGAQGARTVTVLLVG